MSEINLKYSDLSLVGTFTFQKFYGLDIEEERAKKVYERIKEKNRALTYYLQKRELFQMRNTDVSCHGVTIVIIQLMKQPIRYLKKEK